MKLLTLIVISIVVSLLVISCSEHPPIEIAISSGVFGDEAVPKSLPVGEGTILYADVPNHFGEYVFCTLTADGEASSAVDLHNNDKYLNGGHVWYWIFNHGRGNDHSDVEFLIKCEEDEVDAGSASVSVFVSVDPTPDPDFLKKLLEDAKPTAICRDGTESYSANRRGTCSHHGGVAIWLE